MIKYSIFMDKSISWYKKGISSIGNITRELASWKNHKMAEKFLKEHPQPKLSVEEKRDIDKFWGEYNIKYPNYSWFEMYYGVTGIHDPRFIPDPILAKICYPFYNFGSHVKGWDDKNVYELLVPNAIFPYSLCHCINGKYYDNEWNYYSNNQLQQLSKKMFYDLNGATEIICKKTCGSFAGRGVNKVEISSAEDIYNYLLMHKSKNLIIQKKVKQHSFFDQFCRTSTNIIRVISWRYEGEIIVLSASIRYGIEGSFTDVAYVDGKEIVYVVGIDNDGYVNNRFVNFDGNCEETPRIMDKKVPSWEKLNETVKQAHRKLLFFDYVGWDFIIDEGGSPICIEYNIDRPGTILYQFANGPLAGNNTNQFLAFLKEAPSNTIPNYFRK